MTHSITQEAANVQHDTVDTPTAPQALGPYSQAVVVGETVYCSGQIPLDPATAHLVEGDIGNQVTRCVSNLSAVLEAVGSSLSSVAKTTLFLTAMEDYAEANLAYERAFGSHAPARSTVSVNGLPAEAKVKIDCIAYIP